MFNVETVKAGCMQEGTRVGFRDAGGPYIRNALLLVTMLLTLLISKVATQHYGCFSSPQKIDRFFVGMFPVEDAKVVSNYYH